MVFVGTIGRCPEKLTPFLGGRGVSSAFDEGLEHAKQYLGSAGSGHRDCRRSRAGCWKPFAVFSFADGQPDKALSPPTQPGTAARPVFW